MLEKAKIDLGEQKIECHILEGTENEKAIDISRLRSDSGFVTIDPGIANSGSCLSAITYINGEKGILRYRGYPIEDLCKKCSFLEVTWLLIFGELPSSEELDGFRKKILERSALPKEMELFFKGFPKKTHPMAMLSSTVNAISGIFPNLLSINSNEDLIEAAVNIIAKISTISAYIYRSKKGLPLVTPRPDLSYPGNFLHMMFSRSGVSYEIHPDIEQALNLFLILHADHEQNCSTSTVRMVGSSKTNMFSAVASGICALWGPLHGGANAAVIKMLEDIRDSGQDIQYFVDCAKDKIAGFKLMGFGHRVYKNFDPRSRILKSYVDKVLDILNIEDPMLDIAKDLEERALKEPYFAERKLYPNVDFYSGILLSALGIPVEMFTVLFAMGRTAGWIAQWKEGNESPNQRIWRPRQIYIGQKKRHL